jgi:hypothetical protein
MNQYALRMLAARIFHVSLAHPQGAGKQGSSKRRQERPYFRHRGKLSIQAARFCRRDI